MKRNTTTSALNAQMKADLKANQSYWTKKNHPGMDSQLLKEKKAYASFSIQYDYSAKKGIPMKTKMTFEEYTVTANVYKNANKDDSHGLTNKMNAPREIASLSRIVSTRQETALKSAAKRIREEAIGSLGVGPELQKNGKKISVIKPIDYGKQGSMMDAEYEKHKAKVRQDFKDDLIAKGVITPENKLAADLLTMNASEIGQRIHNDYEFYKQAVSTFGKKVKSKKNPNVEYYSLAEWFDSPKAK